MATEFTARKEYTAPTGPQSVSAGYDIKAARLHGQRREEALERRNATLLTDSGEYVQFYCQGINLNQALAGKTAQSKYVRDFYAHNIQIPPVTVQGQCLDQADYGTVVEFIHEAQRSAVGSGGLLELSILGHGKDLTQAKTNPPIATLKGHHEPFKGQGYIPKMDRQYERFVYAPEFSFQFIVVNVFVDYVNIINSEVPAERTWIEIMKTLIQEKPSVEEQKAKEAEKAGEFVGELGNKFKKIFENGF